MKDNGAINIYCENIEEFTRREKIAEAQRNITVTEMLSVLVCESLASTPEEICAELRKSLPEATIQDRARLCMAISNSDRFSCETKQRSFYTEEATAGSHGKVSVVRNRYNEIAFSHFCNIITHPKQVVVQSFATACEDVYDGQSEFCILPVENSQNGRLFGFYSMLDRFELRIVAICEPEEEDGSVGSARYALVGKTLPHRIPRKVQWRFEFSVISDSGKLLSDISGVADIFGARLEKIDSLPVEYDSRLKKYYFTFSLPEENISAFDLFLTGEYSRYTTVGIYPVV